MIIKNLTDTEVTFTIKKLSDNAEFIIKLMPNASTDIDNRYIITDCPPECLEASQDIVEESDVVEVIEAPSPEIIDEVEDEVVEDKDDDEPEPTEFICEECGQEFASARALAMHKSRSHKE